MNKSTDIRKSLVNVDDSVLVIIDIQDHFLDKYEAAVSKPLLEKVVWLMKVAVATTAGDEQTGLNRMHDAGAVVSSVKALTYEWLRTVQNTIAFFEKFPQLEATDLPGCLSL